MLMIVSTPRKLDSQQAIGDLVRRTRRAGGFSQAELATAAGVGRGVLQKLEKGRGTVTLDSALRILAALSMDLSITERSTTRAGQEVPVNAK